MKIIILSEPPRVRSPFKTALKQAAGLAKRKHQVYFVTQKRNLDETISLLGGLPQGVTYLTLRPLPVLSLVFDYLTRFHRYVEGSTIDIDLAGMLVSGFFMSKKLFRTHCEYLIAHSTLSPLQMLNLYMSHDLKKVLYLYDIPIHVIMKIVNPKVNSYLVNCARLFEDQVIRNADVLLCATREAAKSWKEIFHVDPIVFRLGCEPSQSFPYPKRDYIISITSWEPQRRPFLLLDLMENLENSKLKLIVAGRWQNKMLLNRFKISLFERKLQDRILLAENISEYKLSQLYREARCIIQPVGPKLYMTALEAAARGTPIIAPSRSEIWELFEHGVHGFKVIEEDIDSYVDAILKLEDEDLLYKMGYQTWKQAHKYSWSSHVASLEEMMQ
jgi:glycosyltransferase involved in cell wall biosynthesis